MQAAKYKDTIGDVSGRIRVLADDMFVFNSIGDGIKGVASGFQIVQGAMALLGDESEDLKKVMEKVVIAQTVVNGVTELGNILQAESAFRTGISVVVTKAKSVATWIQITAEKALNIALGTTAALTTLITGGLVLLIPLVIGIGKWFSSSAKESEKLNKQLEEMKSIAIEVAAEWAKQNPGLAKKSGLNYSTRGYDGAQEQDGILRKRTIDGTAGRLDQDQGGPDGRTRDGRPGVLGEAGAQRLDVLQPPAVIERELDQHLARRALAHAARGEQHGHQTREHPGLNSRGYQVQHAGHWMPLLWNSAFKRYTADRRLSLLVQSFAASKPANYKAEPHSAAGKEL
jgi:hypothetical protein